MNMDDKKKTNTVITEETNTDTQETNTAPTIPAEPSAPPSPWEDKVSIRLFKDDVNYRDDVFVAVNGHSFQIQRGVEVEVPRCIAEVIANSEVQDHAASMLIERLEREYEQKAK